MKIVVRAYNSERDRDAGKTEKSEIAGEAATCRELYSMLMDQLELNVYLSYYKEDGTEISDYETAWALLGGSIKLVQSRPSLFHYLDEEGNLVYTG